MSNIGKIQRTLYLEELKSLRRELLSLFPDLVDFSKAVHLGISHPQEELGEEKDWYLNVNTGVIYIRLSEGWGSISEIASTSYRKNVITKYIYRQGVQRPDAPAGNIPFNWATRPIPVYPASSTVWTSSSKWVSGKRISGWSDPSPITKPEPVLGEQHDRQHSITSEDDHATEIDHADKVAGWDEEGKPNATPSKQVDSSKLHDRLHKIDNPDDHEADPENKERIIILDDTDGKPVLIDLQGSSDNIVNIEKDYIEKKIVISVDETKIDHNNLLNWEADRHRKMNYSEVLKSYVINP